MEWTREKRYLPYNKWDAKTLMELQAQALTSPQQVHYHIHPISGLINDPNGFSYYNGEYHLFCQSYPFGPVHGMKSWIHFASPDMVHWRYLGPAIYPDTEFDNAGAYSGSGMVHNGKLLLMYSGNHRDKDWKRISYQVVAEMDKDNQIKKWDKPLITPPAHVTEHFRDPQLFEHNGKYYVILGAQDKETESGQIEVYESDNLKDWHDLGYLHFTNEKMGYMIECPNLVFVDNQPVLIFCPQGLDKNIAPYDNIYPNMYMVGSDINLDQDKFTSVQPHPLNLDDGFDVYATQAFNAPDGKAYAISWVGLPDLTYPTDRENWANVYSQVKELEVKDNQLYQHPLKAIKELVRDPKLISNQAMITEHSSRQYELELNIDKGQAGKLYLAADPNLTSGLILDFNTNQEARLIIDRGHFDEVVNPDYGTQREILLSPNTNLKLDIFIDGSLAEIFVNDGQHVATLRFIAPTNNQLISFDHDLNYNGKFGKMDSIM